MLQWSTYAVPFLPKLITCIFLAAVPFHRSLGKQGWVKSIGSFASLDAVTLLIKIIVSSGSFY
jgi:hypothetical protein